MSGVSSPLSSVWTWYVTPSYGMSVLNPVITGSYGSRVCGAAVAGTFDLPGGGKIKLAQPREAGQSPCKTWLWGAAEPALTRPAAWTRIPLYHDSQTQRRPLGGRYFGAS